MSLGFKRLRGVYVSEWGVLMYRSLCINSLLLYCLVQVAMYNLITNSKI